MMRKAKGRIWIIAAVAFFLFCMMKPVCASADVMPEGWDVSSRFYEVYESGDFQYRIKTTEICIMPALSATWE